MTECGLQIPFVSIIGSVMLMLIDNIYFPFLLIPEISSFDVSRIGLIRINCMEKHIGYVCKREVDILG